MVTKERETRNADHDSKLERALVSFSPLDPCKKEVTARTNHEKKANIFVFVLVIVFTIGSITSDLKTKLIFDTEILNIIYKEKRV